jgi:hypothetical protein
VERFVGFYSTLKDELENFVRINGRRNVHELNLSDILTINHEIAQYTDIQHA